MACCANYCQPPIPAPCKPKDQFIRADDPMEGCTVYRMSYEPACTSGCRPPPMRAHDNLKPACCPLECRTTHRLSFQCPPCVEPARPVIPCDRNVIGEGPLSCLTTVRHDYGPKPILKLAPIKPPTQLRCSDAPLEGTTIMAASYQCPCPADPQRSYKPIAVYSHPCQPFQDETIAKMSYVPWPLKKKEHYPWACKPVYKCPCVPMECSTIMKCSYNGVCGDHRREKLKVENANIITPCSDFENCTVYRKSFCPADCGNCRPPPMRAHDNLKPACCPLESRTTHRMSFQCPPCTEPARPVIPCDRNVIGEGPLSCLTTVRHDYGPKPILKLAPIKPPTQLRCSDQPIDGTTIMAASYQCPCPADPQRSYKPISVYCPPCQPFQDETIAKMSYVPWPAKKKEHYPWACKPVYKCPCVPMSCASIYSASFIPPGACASGACAPCRPAPSCGNKCSPGCRADCFVC